MADDDAAPLSLRQGSTDPELVRRHYDDWAASYDDTLAAWNYRAPGDAADLLAPRLSAGARVLDVGCGTGLFGQALRDRVDVALDGIDISQPSLDRARSRGYARVAQHDLQHVPLPAETDAYDAAASVGVLTYIAHAEALLRDMCRCVRPGGAIAFTQRDDLWETRDYPGTLAQLAEDGLWTVERVSEPRAYLPANAEFGDEVKVVHVLATVAARGG